MEMPVAGVNCGVNLLRQADTDVATMKKGKIDTVKGGLSLISVV
jgi:hypothetical protein